MRLTTLIPLSLLLVAASPYEERRPVEELTAVERAFAAKAKEITPWPAFSQFIADDGVIFRPEPVNGKTWLKDAEPYPGTLEWWPTFVEVSCDDQLGWSTGPVLNADGLIHSQYVTVWARQTNGDWRFIFDQGSPHEGMKEDRRRTDPPTTVRHTCDKTSPAAGEKAEKSLFAADDALSARRAKNTQTAYRASFSEQARFHRWGSFFHGKEAALEALKKDPPTFVDKRLGGRAAQSGDFGFTYGDTAWVEPGRGDQKGYYFRVWRWEGGQWKLALDQLRPLTPPPRPAKK